MPANLVGSPGDASASPHPGRVRRSPRRRSRRGAPGQVGSAVPVNLIAAVQVHARRIESRCRKSRRREHYQGSDDKGLVTSPQSAVGRRRLLMLWWELLLACE